uniref:Non-structural maintenance of chromosomes element 1 homolog n=1 Tax=Canis lupus familiaris TaxID=9615 RepID=A0A8C0PXM6_CANLF
MEEGRAERRRRTEAPSHMQGGTRRAGVMTDVHRRFLQLLMTHGVLEEWDVRRLQKHCYRVHDRTAAVEELEDFINNINSVLESLYIEIKKGATEDDGRPVYALVNLATTSVSKMASDFAENELDLFRKALELIIDSETGFASSTNILNLVDQLKGKKMRKKEAEQVLQKFVQNKWLIEMFLGFSHERYHQEAQGRQALSWPLTSAVPLSACVCTRWAQVTLYFLVRRSFPWLEAAAHGEALLHYPPRDSLPLVTERWH